MTNNRYKAKIFNHSSRFFVSLAAKTFALYERTTRVIKRIAPHMQLGGLAGSGSGDQRGVALWSERFLAVCAERT